MVNTILTDDERRALIVRYGSSATPDENNDYMTGDYPLVCAIEAAVLAKLQNPQTVWQQRGDQVIALLNKSLALSTAFHMGAWWADRPWRNDKEQR